MIILSVSVTIRLLNSLFSSPSSNSKSWAAPLMPASGLRISCARRAVILDIDNAAPLNKVLDFATCSSEFFCTEITIKSSLENSGPT